MSALASGYTCNGYYINPPYSRDIIGIIEPHARVLQKYRKSTNKGGPPNSGLILGSNTNLGTRWYAQKYDYKSRLVMVPLNNRDALGARNMPEWRVKTLFKRGDNQPG